MARNEAGKGRPGRNLRQNMAGKMTQLVKERVANPDDQSLMPPNIHDREQTSKVVLLS